MVAGISLTTSPSAGAGFRSPGRDTEPSPGPPPSPPRHPEEISFDTKPRCTRRAAATGWLARPNGAAFRRLPARRTRRARRQARVQHHGRRCGRGVAGRAPRRPSASASPSKCSPVAERRRPRERDFAATAGEVEGLPALSDPATRPTSYSGSRVLRRTGGPAATPP